MESECIKIKIEPEITVSSSFNGVISDNDAKQNCENVNYHEEKHQKIESKPEFVNIKIEPCFPDDVVKIEPLSSNITTEALHDVPVIYKPGYKNFNTEVSVKEEPTETEMEENCDYIVPDTAPPAPIQYNMFISDVSEEILSLNSTVDGKYMCPICHKRFANKGNVNRHILLHTKNKLECKVCFRKFVKEVQYQKHILTHSTEKRFKCEQCEKLFRTSSNLEQHKRIHMTVKPFECQSCTRRFAVKANLMRHQYSGSCKRLNVDPIVCTICNKVFQKEFLLKSHLRKHTTERPFVCDKCKMTFKYKSTLIRHVQLHNNIKPYSCNICKKKFTHSGLIKPHMRKHTGEKPYACPVCKKLFAHKHNMQRHTLRHDKIKNLVCGVCNKTFPKESRLIYHMRTHTKAKPFVCGICGKTFSHKQNIVRHYSRKHPNDQYNCAHTDASVAKYVWENLVLKSNVDVQPEVELACSDDESLSNVKSEEIIGK